MRNDEYIETVLNTFKNKVNNSKQNTLDLKFKFDKT